MPDIVPSAIDETFVPRARPGVAGVELDGEAVLLDESTGAIHTLNPTATLIWTCCDGSGTLADIIADLREMCPDGGDVIADDVLRAARHFGDLGLLEGVRPAAGGGDAGGADRRG